MWNTFAIAGCGPATDGHDIPAMSANVGAEECGQVCAWHTGGCSYTRNRLLWYPNPPSIQPYRAGPKAGEAGPKNTQITAKFNKTIPNFFPIINVNPRLNQNY